MKEYEIFCLVYRDFEESIVMESKQYYVKMFADLKATVEKDWLEGLE